MIEESLFFMKRSTLEKLQDFHRAGNAGIHQELALFLREKIASGELLAGEQLPVEDEPVFHPAGD